MFGWSTNARHWQNMPWRNPPGESKLKTVVKTCIPRLSPFLPSVRDLPRSTDVDLPSDPMICLSGGFEEIKLLPPHGTWVIEARPASTH